MCRKILFYLSRLSVLNVMVIIRIFFLNTYHNSDYQLYDYLFSIFLPHQTINSIRAGVLSVLYSFISAVWYTIDIQKYLLHNTHTNSQTHAYIIFFFLSLSGLIALLYKKIEVFLTL